MPINEKDYQRILNDLNKEFDPHSKKDHRIANWIIIIIVGSFLGWLAIVGATQ